MFGVWKRKFRLAWDSGAQDFRLKEVLVAVSRSFVSALRHFKH